MKQEHNTSCNSQTVIELDWRSFPPATSGSFSTPCTLTR